MSGELGKLSRAQLLEALRAIPCTNPSTEGLSDKAIAGTLRKYRYATQRGQRIGGGLVNNWLKAGGDPGWGEDVPKVDAWWRTSKGRAHWIEQNAEGLRWLSQTYDWQEYAETAVISLVQAKREPTVETVRSLALQARQQQDAHDEACKQVKPHDSRFFEKARTSREIAAQMVEEERTGEVA